MELSERGEFMIYNLEELREAYNAGEHFKFLFFWGHTPAADGHINEACLSQWWKCGFKVDEVEYSCAEQFMMVEASPRDRIWGIGMGKANPDAENPLRWRGTNLLGFALTEVRDQLLKEARA